MNIQDVVNDIFERGPCRVMISESEAVTPKRAREEHRIIPAIIFIRNDGWTLGAPEQFKESAYETWKDEWVGFIRSPSKTAAPMKYYIEGA